MLWFRVGERVVNKVVSWKQVNWDNDYILKLYSSTLSARKRMKNANFPSFVIVCGLTQMGEEEMTQRKL